MVLCDVQSVDRSVSGMDSATVVMFRCDWFVFMCAGSRVNVRFGC